MPRAKEGIKYSKKYSGRDIDMAVEAVKNGMPKRQAALKFNIPRSTIQFRLSNNFTKTTHGPSPILKNEEEDILVQWIINNHKKGFPRRKEDIQSSVKDFLDQKPRQNPFKDNMPGSGWYKAFLKRHPNLSLRTSESVTSSSATISETDVKKWFQNIYNYLQSENYHQKLQDESRIFNGDETNFQLCPKNNKVIAPRGTKNVYEVDQGQAKSTLTVMFTFSASGDVMIIYPYKRLPSDIAKSVPTHWGIGTSDNGWMKAELFYEYIANVFYPSLKEKNIVFSIILFVDGHATHLTYKLSELCTKLEIILISLYPNATRLLQPADVSAFKPIKNGWKKGVIEWRRQNPSEALTKEKFAPILKNVIDKYVNPCIIKNGFRACGIFPWNSEALDYSKCLGKKREQEIERSQATECSNTSVRKVLHFERFEQIVGEEKCKLFEEIEKHSQDQSEDFFILYRLWKEYRTNYEENIATTERNTENNTTVMSIEDIPIIFEDELPENIFVEIENNMPLIDNLNPPKDIFDHDENTPIKNNVSSLYTNSSKNNNKEEHYPSPQLGDFLQWPQTPERKGVKKTERLPFVLTSAKWQEMQSKKLEFKKEQERLKEERKRKRLETKKSKENISVKKRGNKKLVDSMVTKKSTEKLKEQSTFSTKEFKKTEKNSNTDNNVKVQTSPIKKKINIISCITLPKANREEIGASHVRKLSFEEAQDIETKEIEYITTEDTSYESIFIRNKRVEKNICFTCTFNINKLRQGIQCSSCLRTYHFACIYKTMPDIPKTEIFSCRTCTRRNKLPEIQ